MFLNLTINFLLYKNLNLIIIIYEIINSLNYL